MTKKFEQAPPEGDLTARYEMRVIALLKEQGAHDAARDAIAHAIASGRLRENEAGELVPVK